MSHWADALSIFSVCAAFLFGRWSAHPTQADPAVLMAGIVATALGKELLTSKESEQ